MNRILLALTAVMALALMNQSAYAKPRKACSRADGTIVVKKICKAGNGEQELTLDSLAPAESSPDESVVLCYANISSSGNLLSYGGKGTIGVSVARTSTGVYNVTCNGLFPGIMEKNDLSTFATVQSGAAVKRNVHALNLTSDESKVAARIRIYDSGGSAANLGFSVMVLGQTSS